MSYNPDVYNPNTNQPQNQYGHQGENAPLSTNYNAPNQNQNPYGHQGEPNPQYGQGGQQYPNGGQGGQYPQGQQFVVIYQNGNRHQRPLHNLNTELINAYRYARTAKILAIIDIIFSIFWLFSGWVFLILIVPPICGYYGARSYNHCLLLVYVIYLIAEFCFRIAALILWNGGNGGIIALYVIIIIIEIWIAYIVGKAWNYIRQLSEDDKRTLISIENLPGYSWW